MLQSSSPSLISLSISQSALFLFLMPLLLLLLFSKFLQFHTSTHYDLCIFLSSFFSMRVSNGHTGSISRYYLLFLSIAFISGRLYSRVLSVCKGKSHKIFYYYYYCYYCFLHVCILTKLNKLQ